MGATSATEGRVAFTTLEPIGPVLAISAFNHPLNLIVHQVGAAIAAGCPVVAKPARETPLSCAAFLRLLAEAGLPEGHATMIACDDARAERMVRDERVAYLSFIGSAAVGWRLRGLVAPGARVGLENGGAAPVIVDESADLAATAKLLAKGGYYHAGQVCVSVQRVFVHRRVARELEARLAEAASGLVVGDPSHEGTDVGPLIRAREVERVERWVAEAVAGGASLAVGGARVGRQAYAPTLLVEPPADAKVMREEVFGPVVAVSTYDALDDAIARSNGVPWAFQAAIFTNDLARAMQASRRLDASTVLVNDHTAFRADWMPFGGRRGSGLGLGGLHLGVRELCAAKLVVLRPW